MSSEVTRLLQKIRAEALAKKAEISASPVATEIEATIRRAIQQVRRAEYTATGIVMNPDDLAELELTKDADGNYIIVDPVEGGQGRIWRLPIVDTTAMPAGQFLVDALATAAQVLDRQQVTFEISTENTDDFEKNVASARIEERLALAVYRPERGNRRIRSVLTNPDSRSLLIPAVKGPSLSPGDGPPVSICEDHTMPSGRVIKWVTDRGYGFIQADGDSSNAGEFAHISAMPDNEAPRIGQRFDFDKATGIDGRSKAVNVRAVTSWGEAAYL